MKPKQLKNLLMSNIRRVVKNSKLYCINPEKDFSRKRKLTMEKLITGIIGMQSGSLTNELIDFFNASSDVPTASAFSQQRCKISPNAFLKVFREFSHEITSTFKEEIHLLAVDGSRIQIATAPEDTDSFYLGSNGQKPYNLLHLNALYDLKHCIYSDAIIQKDRIANEHKAFAEMIDRSNIPKAIVIADRGYESYNNMAHVQEKGWYFLIRIKDGKTGMKEGYDLPKKPEYDVPISMNLIRRQNKETKELYKDRNHYKFIPATSTFDYLPSKSRKADPTLSYNLRFRIVRFKISENGYETVLTNLEPDTYPPEKLKELYAVRWGIETSFRDLKYTTGMLDFHSKKVMCIQQEIYAHLIMYNFAEMITSHVVIDKKQRKHTYKANFSVAVHMCRLFYRGKASSPDLETIISKNLVPIRPDRHRERKLTGKIYHSFLYRVA
jgi:hypothetical protein